MKNATNANDIREVRIDSFFLIVEQISKYGI